jgi:quercetin dioxygenase-like cupin family protein
MTRALSLGAALLALGAAPLAAQPAPVPADSAARPTHAHEAAVAWTASAQYPEALKKVYRYRPLIGGSRAPVPQQDVLMGVLELAPGATYPGHAHPSPEIYYVMSGRARWTVGGETFDAVPGTAVYTPPNTLHRMVNTGDEPLRTVYFWWAPEGKREVIQVGSRLLEPVPDQPPRAVFPRP